jgi:Flp pilus assembly protein TadD
MKFKDEFGAITEMKRALELKPDTAEAENNLAWLLATAEDHKLRNPEQSLSLARGAVKDAPRPNAAYLDTLAEALLLNGQVSEALSTEQQALALDPQNAEMQSRLAHFREAADQLSQQAATGKP